MRNRVRRSRSMVLLVSLLVLVGVLGATPGSAEAKCKLGCLKAKVNALTTTVTALRTQVTTLQTQTNTLRSCLRRRNVARYGDVNGTFGYMWDSDGNGAFDLDTSALDFTSGNPAGTLTVPMVFDSCNTLTAG